MKRAIAFLLAPALLGSSEIPHQYLLGLWKSNEEKTLASMRATPGITQKAKEIFENDFFGKLIVEYKVDSYRAKFVNEEDNVKEFDHYYSYRVLEKGDDYFILETRVPLVKDNIRQITVFVDGDCYYELVSRWNFKEYFCRVK